MNPPNDSCLSLHDAALTLGTGPDGQHDIEVALAHAIEHGELHANVKRWATEQWEGERLEGNIDRMRTFIERADLEAWLSAGGLPNRA